VGSLVLFRSGPEFFPEEVRLLESIASQAALAITNARLHQEMVQLSRTDPLTGIANRRALFDRLQFEIERCDRFDETLGVVLVDVDHFKRLNDRFGHTGGDAVLSEVAAVLGRCLRKVDHVARYGGEEFAIVLPGAGRAAALAVGEKLRAAIAGASFDYRGEPSGEVVTISVGVALYPTDARELSALIDCADAALYAAKRAGRNAVRAHAEGMREHPGRERDVSITADVEPPAR
jgi:diguanylate cyclase (GGDEF)-like protein